MLSPSFLIFLLTLTVSLSAFGQSHDQQPYERVLVPLMATAAVPGAFGSLWVPMLTMRNDADVVLDVTDNPFSLCAAFGTSCASFGPHDTFLFSFPTVNVNGGIFLYVGNPGREAAVFSLRIQDVSRQALTWGTTVPVIREKDVFTTRLRIVDVPVDARFRSALRIYDFDSAAEAPAAVRLRIFESHGQAALVDTIVPLIAAGHNQIQPTNPAFAMIGDIVSSYPQLADVVDPTMPPGSILPPRLRIEIEPATPGLRFWAFVTVTHNETQHVTALVPAR